MNPGKMRAWLKFYQVTKAKNAFGSMEESARTLVMDVKAERVFTSRKEKMTLGEAEVKRRIYKTRYYDQINDTALIVEHGDDVLDIIDVEEFGRKQGLIFTCQSS